MGPITIRMSTARYPAVAIPSIVQSVAVQILGLSSSWQLIFSYGDTTNHESRFRSQNLVEGFVKESSHE